MRQDPKPDFEPHIFWTLYGVNPMVHGVRTEDAVADLDSEAAALELLAKLFGSFHPEAGTTTTGYLTAAPRGPQPQARCNPGSIDVTLEFRIDLALLRRQKRALIEIHEGAQVTAVQEDAAEGILNMLDHIQDTIFDQGLASEEDIFPHWPSLFETEAAIDNHAV